MLAQIPITLARPSRQESMLTSMKSDGVLIRLEVPAASCASRYDKSRMSDIQHLPSADGAYQPVDFPWHVEELAAKLLKGAQAVGIDYHRTKSTKLQLDCRHSISTGQQQKV